MYFIQILIMDQNSIQDLEVKCDKFFRSVNIQITRNMKTADIQTRPSKSNGLWCCTLLPIILNIYSIQHEVSALYKFVAVLSIGLMIYCMLFIVFLSLSCMVLQEYYFGGCIASSLISVLLMYTILGHDLPFCLFYSVPSLFMFSWLLRTLLMQFQKTFTIGEAMVLTQSIVMFVAMAVAKFTCELDKTDEELDFIYTIVYTVLFVVGIMIIGICLLTEEQRHLHSLGIIVGIGGAFALLILYSILGVGFIFQTVHYIFLEKNRAQIFLFWSLLVGISVAVLTVRTQLAVKAGTVTRKSFHVLASLVFMSGILLDVNLMTLAAGVAFALLLLVEALRKSKIDPISSALQSAFLVYSDEKDCGCFAVTPLYLLLGLACPLALVPRRAGCQLELLSGVLAIGVGDSAASWFGAKYGFNKWPGGHRTYEGTAFNILSQVATVYALLLFELLHSKNALIRATIAAIITGFVEAKTNQVDNLVLPLVTIIAFQSTWFLS